MMPLQVKLHTQDMIVDIKTVVGDILRSLPDYFTYEPSIKEYCLRTVNRASSTFIALTESGIIAGFALLFEAYEETSEIEVMAVRPGWQRQGVGSALLQAAESYARQQGKEFVLLKTIGPSENDALAAQTYSFFLKNDYCPLEEFEFLWQNCYCTLMVKKL